MKKISRYDQAPVVKFVEFDLFGEVEKQIGIFLDQYKDKCQIALAEGYLGETIRKGKNGILGYMRTSYAIQFKAINNLSFPVPIYAKNEEIINFFRGDFIRNVALEKGFVSPVFKKDHFEIIKIEHRKWK